PLSGFRGFDARAETRRALYVARGSEKPCGMADIQMIKSELIARLVLQNLHLYQRDIEKLVRAMLGEIVRGLARGNRVELRGFGAFSVKFRPARAGRNPRTGAQLRSMTRAYRFSKLVRKCAND